MQRIHGLDCGNYSGGVGTLDAEYQIEQIYGRIRIHFLLDIHPSLVGREGIDGFTLFLAGKLLRNSFGEHCPLDAPGSIAGEDIRGADAVLTAFGGYGCRAYRVAAESEEGVVSTHVLHAEYLLKGGTDRFLHICFGGGVLRLEISRLGGQQGRAVQLAVGIQRQLVQFDIEGGEHISGQLVRDAGLDIIPVNIFVGSVIGGKINLSVGVLMVSYRRLAHTLHCADDCLGLAGLDPLAVDLYHPVAAVEIDYITVFVPADDVAGMQKRIIAVAFLEGVGNKGLGVLLGKPEIARGKMPRKAKLALLGLSALLVKYICEHRLDRSADRGVLVFPVDTEIGGRTAGFGLAVGADDVIVLRISVCDSLAAHQQAFQLCAAAVEEAQHLGAYEGVGNAVFLEALRQHEGVSDDLKGQQQADRARVKRSPCQMQRHHKGERGADSLYRIFGNIRDLAVACDRAQHAYKIMQHALWSPGGAGGIDQHSGSAVLRVNCFCKRLLHFDAAHESCIYHGCGSAVFADELKPVLGVFVGQRSIGGSRIPHAQLGGEIIDAAGQLNGHKAAGGHAEPYEPCSDPAGEDIRFPEGKTSSLRIHKGCLIPKGRDIFRDDRE